MLIRDYFALGDILFKAICTTGNKRSKLKPWSKPIDS